MTYSESHDCLVIYYGLLLWLMICHLILNKHRLLNIKVKLQNTLSSFVLFFCAFVRQFNLTLVFCCYLQAFKGNFTYNFGDHGNIIVMIEPRKRTRSLLWVNLSTTFVCKPLTLVILWFSIVCSNFPTWALRGTPMQWRQTVSLTALLVMFGDKEISRRVHSLSKSDFWLVPCPSLFIT